MHIWPLWELHLQIQQPQQAAAKHAGLSIVIASHSLLGYGSSACLSPVAAVAASRPAIMGPGGLKRLTGEFEMNREIEPCAAVPQSAMTLVLMLLWQPLKPFLSTSQQAHHLLMGIAYTHALV